MRNGGRQWTPEKQNINEGCLKDEQRTNCSNYILLMNSAGVGFVFMVLFFRSSCTKADRRKKR